MNQVLYSCRGKLTKWDVTIAYEFELNVKSMQFWLLLFCSFPPGAIKPADRTFWDLTALLWRLMVTLSLALCLQALESDSLFPRAALPWFPILLLQLTASEMVSEMTFTFEFLFQLQLKFRMLMVLGILFQMCKSLFLLLFIPVETNQE